jgi:hypothetical protein
MLLDFGYRSKCCKAPIRIAEKKIKKTSERIKVWVCLSCMTRDVDIIPKEEALGQTKNSTDSP